MSDPVMAEAVTNVATAISNVARALVNFPLVWAWAQKASKEELVETMKGIKEYEQRKSSK